MITTITPPLYALGLTLLTAVTPPPLPTPSSCADELALFSPCLPYVSSPPNNLSDTASDSCCHAFSSALNFTNGVCRCYLVRQPSILRFAVNDTRVLSLSSVCTIRDDNNSSMGNGSMESLCSGSKKKPSSWFLLVLLLSFSYQKNHTQFLNSDFLGSKSQTQCLVS